MLLTSSFVLEPIAGRKRARVEVTAERSPRRKINPNHPLDYTVASPGGRRSSCLKYIYKLLDDFDTQYDGMGASLQTLELATSLFDRYMVSLDRPLMDREDLELLCVACVSLATKFHEVQSYLITEPYYTTDTERDRVVGMESRILAAIQWNVHLKNSLVEKVFDLATPSEDDKRNAVVRRAFQSVWKYTYFIQGFSASELTHALCTIVMNAPVDHFCTRQILRAAMI